MRGRFTPEGASRGCWREFTATLWTACAKRSNRFRPPTSCAFYWCGSEWRPETGERGRRVCP